MAHIGLCCFWGRGHLNPFLDLGTALVKAGHAVTCFAGRSAAASIRAAGLQWNSFFDVGPVDVLDRQITPPWLSTLLRAIESNTIALLRHGPAVLRESRVDAIVADQFELAASTVAEHVGLPFATLAVTPPIYLERYVPPVFVEWPQRFGGTTLRFNERANSLVEQAVAPAMSLINEQRRGWGLRALTHVNETVSRIAFLTTCPAGLDLPRVIPINNLFYLGPFARDSRNPTGFPWNKLSGKPLIYASLGTLRNVDRKNFQTIAEACAEFDMQLVLTLGGGRIEPSDIETARTDAIIVYFAPQREVLAHAAITITHGGANTTLDSLAAGVPIVAIPMTDDQPGVVERVKRIGAGVVLPSRRLSVRNLRRAIDMVASDERYRAAAASMQQQIEESAGVKGALRIIEERLLHQGREGAAHAALSC